MPTLLALIFIWERNGQFGLDWLQAGRAEADRIGAGEWWRAITALTLHADLKHLLATWSSARSSRHPGPLDRRRTAWLATLVSGALGNLLNAWIQPAATPRSVPRPPSSARSGVQVAFEWVRRRELRRTRWRRWPR
jgi:membrane associated rhomboid family serine protease